MSSRPRIAVLYQELDPHLINGVRKPKKPGGYRDSGANIAYALKHRCRLDVVSPSSLPDASKDADWVFGDSEASILAAVEKKTSKKLDKVAEHLRIVGQPPKLVELYDDKNYVNEMLRAKGGFRLPAAQLVRDEGELNKLLATRRLFPIISKPVRGQGSHGVKVY